MNVEVKDVDGHEDGSATFTFEVPEESKDLLSQYGLKLLLYAGVMNKTVEEMFGILEKELLKDENSVLPGGPVHNED